MKNRLFSILVSAFFIATSLPTAHAADDAYTRLRDEEIQAKQTQIDEFGNRIVSMQKQLEEDQKAIAHSQEKVWNDFTQSLEVERKGMQEKMGSLDQRQKLFENELRRKREEDEIRIKDKQAEISRMSAQVTRLKSDLENDRKLLQSHLDEMKNQIAARAQGAANLANQQQQQQQNEVLGNQAIKISQMSGNEMLNGGSSIQRRQVRAEYYIEIGDILAIDVWRVPDFSRPAAVRPDGRISMPVVGDLDVVGMSLVQLKELLTQKYSEYVWNPQVSISVQTFGGRKFVILGEIKGPGIYRYQQDVSLIEAIALAGGFTPSSKRGKIMIIRGDLHKQPQVKIISANLDNLLNKGMLSENLTVLPNDIIYVTKDILGDYRDVIDQFISPTLSVPTDFFVLRSAIVTARNRRF